MLRLLRRRGQRGDCVRPAASNQQEASGTHYHQNSRGNETFRFAQILAHLSRRKRMRRLRASKHKSLRPDGSSSPQTVSMQCTFAVHRSAGVLPQNGAQDEAVALCFFGPQFCMVFCRLAELGSSPPRNAKTLGFLGAVAPKHCPSGASLLCRQIRLVHFGCPKRL